MLNHPTHERLTQLRLFGMARALAEQAGQTGLDAFTFEERLGLLVDREMAERQNRLTASRLRRARLKQAALAEDIDYRHARGLDNPVPPPARRRMGAPAPERAALRPARSCDMMHTSLCH
jgi:IstB-like ATP binding protein